MTRAGLAAAITLGGAFTQVAIAQDDVYAVLDRATAYVERFERDFGSIVAEERYEQNVRRAANANTVVRGIAGPMQTVLRSDFLLVQVAGEGWIPFRDVFERDGEPVRDREERLATVFLSGDRDALEQARAIMNEGARYNIGNVNRNINTPTLALTFLTARHRHRFDFKLAGRGDADAGVPVEFRERTRPTIISTTGGTDLPARGRFWIDASTGTVLRTTLDAVDTSVEAHITVTFERDDSLGFHVPMRMEERYRRQRDPMEVRGVATYSRFRRFQVSTSEELAK